MNKVMIQEFEEYNQIMVYLYTKIYIVEDKNTSLLLLPFHSINIHKLYRMN